MPNIDVKMDQQNLDTNLIWASNTTIQKVIVAFVEKSQVSCAARRAISAVVISCKEYLMPMKIVYFERVYLFCDTESILSVE